MSTAPQRRQPVSLLPTFGLSAVYFLVLWLPSLSPHYGFYSDELYYLACAKRLAWGYVDQPPLFPFLLRLHSELWGDSLLALRMLPALIGALVVFLTGWMARRLGGGVLAQTLGALAVMVSGTSLVMFSFFSVNCLEVLLWTCAGAVLLELCRRPEPRLWLLLGGVLGLSLLTKHTTVVWIAGLAAGTLLSERRRDLKTPWPWLGALAALAIFAPNLHWQWAHEWTSLDFYRRLSEENIPTPPWIQFVRQIAIQNPATFPIWAGGVCFYLLSPSMRRFRALGLLFATVLVLAMLGGRSRADRIAGVYPFVFAAGAVWWEAQSLLGSRWRRWLIRALPVGVVALGLVAASLVLPILPPRLLIDHPLFEGDDFRPTYGPERLPYILGNRTHWQDFVGQVEGVAGELDPRELSRSIVLTDYFGHAGALEYYGSDLPPIYSVHTNYWLWGPPATDPQTVISLGIDETLLQEHFQRVEVVSVFRCEYCPPWQDEFPIHIARGSTRSFGELWRTLGEVGGMDFRRRRLLQQAERDRGED